MKKALLLLCLAGFGVILAACGGTATPAAQQGTPAADTAVPARPVIQMSMMGEDYAGMPGAYCWLQAADDIRCEPDPLDMEL
ncbi:MAG: hypothetical protein JW910_00050, partial [Anaerolineae bacterium]|nr:hypothetical protein [Anaerolineae bacterium]